MVRWVLIFGVGVVAWSLADQLAVGQPFLREPPSAAPMTSPPSPNTPANGTAAAPGSITESKLGPIYVRDQNGKPVLFPLITVEELDRLIELKQQQRVVEPPRYSFTAGATIVGAADGVAADLQATFPIQINRTTEPAEEWVRIPLRLNQAVLLPPVGHQGEGELRTEFDPQGDGYIVWLRAPSGTTHVLTLHCKVPLNRKNGTRQLQLRLPDTSLQMKLTVNGSGSEAAVNTGNLLDRTRRISAQQTELTVDAAGGDLDLSWREREELPPVLAAFGNIAVTLNGSQVEYDAQLNVRSYNAPIDSFVVRLPRGAELIGINQATQSMLEFVLQPERAEDAGGRQLLVRRLEGKTTGAIEARLRCTVANAVRPDQPTRIEGFEVIDAQNQKGTLDFIVEGDWSIDYQPETAVRRVDELPDVLRQQEVKARFEYDRQPFALATTIREKKTRITVEPTWLVAVDAPRIQLEGKLKYAMTGARLKPLEIETNGWTIEDVTSADLASEGWHVENEKLTIPLSAALQGGGAEFEVTIRATRPHSETATIAASAARLPPAPVLAPWLGHFQPALGPRTVLLEAFRNRSGEVRFGLPRPQADAGLPALVVISPADNVELVPAVGRLRSLINDTLPAEIKSVRQQPPLVYREDAAGPPAQFSGQFRVRPQQVTLELETRLRVEERDTAVEQRFRYAIANEPLTQLRFLVPRTLVETGRFEFLLDGVPATWTKQLPLQPFDAAHLPILVELRDPRIGSCELLFKHRHTHEHPSAKEPVPCTVPMIQAEPDATTTVAWHRLRISPMPTLQVELLDGGWELSDEESEGATGDTIYLAQELPPALQLAVSVDSAPAKGATEVMRAWVQSLLTTQERRDRACFRLRTNESQLAFVLPSGADLASVMVAVNGERTYRFSVSSTGEVRVELPEFFGPRETTVELWYWFSVHPVAIGRLELQPPRLGEASRSERTYWQILLPPNEHLAWHGSDLTAEHAWKQRQFFWARTPHRSQADLEDWVGASRQAEQSGFNTYLFSSVGALRPKTVYTTTRQMAVLMVGGLVLAVGAMVLYQPVLRHPVALMVLGALIMGLAIAYPAAALAASQLALVGLGLVVITGLLMVFLSRPAPKRQVGRPSTAAADSRHSKPASSRSIPAHSNVATVTLQGSLPFSATGNEP